MFDFLLEMLRVIIFGLKEEFGLLLTDPTGIKILVGIYTFFVLLISDIIMWIQDKRGIIWFLSGALDRVVHRESDYGTAEDLSRLVMDYKALFKSLLWANIILIVFFIVVSIANYFACYRYMDL